MGYLHSRLLAYSCADRHVKQCSGVNVAAEMQSFTHKGLTLKLKRVTDGLRAG